jgi:monothiol glutaredoxin
MNLPDIRISDAARRAFEEAAAGGDGDPLRITIDERFVHVMRFDAQLPSDVAVPCGPITIVLDAASALRADGMSIDFAAGPNGSGFTIDNPAQPPAVRPLSARELKGMMDSGVAFELADVRTVEEREIAKIEGSRLLDKAYYDYLLGLDRNTIIVFQCHHGIRSRSAAEHCLTQGFRNLYNLEGGIDAWSQAVDPSVPRY